jgi:hypothetical protein
MTDSTGNLDRLQDLTQPIHWWTLLALLITQCIHFQSIPIVLDEQAVQESMAWQFHSALKMIQNCSTT